MTNATKQSELTKKGAENKKKEVLKQYQFINKQYDRLNEKEKEKIKESFHYQYKMVDAFKEAYKKKGNEKEESEKNSGLENSESANDQPSKQPTADREGDNPEGRKEDLKESVLDGIINLAPAIILAHLLTNQNKAKTTFNIQNEIGQQLVNMLSCINMGKMQDAQDKLNSIARHLSSNNKHFLEIM